MITQTICKVRELILKTISMLITEVKEEIAVISEKKYNKITLLTSLTLIQKWNVIMLLIKESCIKDED